MSKKLTTQKRPPLHPGENLADILKDAGLSANALALQIRVPANRITKIIAGERSITADTALRLGQFFGTSAEIWMNLQFNYDMAIARDALSKKIEKEVIPLAHAAN